MVGGGVVVVGEGSIEDLSTLVLNPARAVASNLLGIDFTEGDRQDNPPDFEEDDDTDEDEQRERAEDEDEEVYTPLFDDVVKKKKSFAPDVASRGTSKSMGKGKKEREDEGVLDTVVEGKVALDQSQVMENYKLSKLYSDAAEEDDAFEPTSTLLLPVLSPNAFGRNMLKVKVKSSFRAIALALRHSAVIEVNSAFLQDENMSFRLDELKDHFPKLLEADSSLDAQNKFSEDFSSQDEMMRLQRQLFEALRQGKPDKIDAIKRQLEFYSNVAGASVLLPPPKAPSRARP